MTTDVFTATGTWTCPAGVTEAWVRCWGGGGAGGGVTATVASGSVNGGGGAGGYYAEKTAYAVTPGNVYTVTVGATKTGLTTGANHGNDTWFDNNTTGVLAKGGRGGSSVSVDGVTGAGGSTTAGSIGDTTRAGGTGANSLADSANSGSGGGGAGSSAAGGNAGSGTTGGTAGTGQGGGGGGGRSTAGIGAAGSVYGGGGAGGRTTSTTDFAGGNGAAGRVEVEYTPPPRGPAPIVANSIAGVSQSGTSMVTTLPTGVTESDLLIMCFARQLATTTTWPAGWTSLVSNTVNNYAMEIRYRWYQNGDTAPTLTTGNSNTKLYRCLRITGADTTQAPEVSTVATATSTAPNSPTLNPTGWDVEDTLWLSIAAWNNIDTGTNAAPSAYPTNYTGGEYNAGTVGPVLTYARRALEAASDDPGAYAAALSVTWFAATVAVRPAVESGPPAEQLAGFMQFIM